MKIKKRDLIIAGSLFVLAVLFTILVKLVDVNNIGPNNSEVGFASINKFFWNLTGENTVWYKISEILGYFALLIAVFYVGFGIYQLIKNKSFKKVNRNIYLLGAFYSIVGLTYIFFEVVVVNFRPILIDGVLEASYPSSHTMLALCICISGVIVNNKLFNKNLVLKVVNIALIVLGLVVVITRYLSGAHWFTDILGALIISAFLLVVLHIAVNIFNSNKLEQENKNE